MFDPTLGIALEHGHIKVDRTTYATNIEDFGEVDTVWTLVTLVVLISIASTIREEISVEIMALVVASLAWMWPTRTIRAQVLSLRERAYVQMAKLNGMSSLEIIWKELFPNLLPYLAASFVSAVGAAVLASVLPAIQAARIDVIKAIHLSPDSVEVDSKTNQKVPDGHILAFMTGQSEIDRVVRLRLVRGRLGQAHAAARRRLREEIAAPARLDPRDCVGRDIALDQRPCPLAPEGEIVAAR